MHRYGFASALLALGGLLLASAPAAAADIDKNKLVGTWMTKSSSMEFTMEFSSKGKCHFEKPNGTLRGTYMVTGNQLKITWKDRYGQEHTFTDTITQLTDKQLVIKEARSIGTIVYRKK